MQICFCSEPRDPNDCVYCNFLLASNRHGRINGASIPSDVEQKDQNGVRLPGVGPKKFYVGKLYGATPMLVNPAIKAKAEGGGNKDAPTASSQANESSSI